MHLSGRTCARLAYILEAANVDDCHLGRHIVSLSFRHSNVANTPLLTLGHLIFILTQVAKLRSLVITSRCDAALSCLVVLSQAQISNLQYLNLGTNEDTYQLVTLYIGRLTCLRKLSLYCEREDPFGTPLAMQEVT